MTFERWKNFSYAFKTFIYILFTFMRFQTFGVSGACHKAFAVTAALPAVCSARDITVFGQYLCVCSPLPYYPPTFCCTPGQVDVWLCHCPVGLTTSFICLLPSLLPAVAVFPCCLPATVPSFIFCSPPVAVYTGFWAALPSTGSLACRTPRCFAFPCLGLRFFYGARYLRCYMPCLPPYVLVLPFMPPCPVDSPLRTLVDGLTWFSSHSTLPFSCTCGLSAVVRCFLRFPFLRFPSLLPPTTSDFGSLF